MLTLKKKKFCDEYLISLNATDACRQAGYHSKQEKHLTVKAQKLLKDPEIKEYLDKRLKEKEEGLIAKQNDVMKYLSGCVLGTQKEINTYILKSGGDGYFQDVIEEREQDLKARDRLKACELMAKIYKLMNQDERIQPKIIINNDIPRKNYNNE